MAQLDYDEDLTLNSWYSVFLHKYENLFNRAANERWMICIPRNNSWIKETNKDKVFTQKIFETHLLKPVKVFSKSNSSEQSEDTENNYITFNGKEVKIEGNVIYCGNGFNNQFKKPSFNNKNKQLELHLESCYSVKILFEETFFNQNDESYMVLCLSQPLEPHLAVNNNNEETTAESELRTLTCPRYKTYGLSLWTRSSNPKLKGILDDKIVNYNQLHIDIRKGVYDDNSLLSEIQGIAANVQDLLLSCKQVLLKDPKLKRLNEISSEKELLKNALEGYVLHGIYETVIQEINNVMASQDCCFNKITRNLYSIKLSFLGVTEEFWPTTQRARRELSKLNRFRTATEKLSCLSKSISFLTPKTGKNLSESQVIGSDELLPLLVYLVIKADIPNWLSNFMYMKHLDFTDQLKEKMGFYLTTLEAALEHIKNEKINFKDLMILSGTKEDQNLQELFQLIFNGNVDAVERLLRQANDLHKLENHDKCHPLCECPKCLNSVLSSRSSYISVSTRDPKGRTSLHIAAICGGHEMVDVLVKHEADVNACDYLGNTPLHLAAMEGNQSVIFLLIYHGANATSVNNNNNSALHLACLGGHDACVKALLYFDPCKLLVKINGSNENGETPLFIAAKWGYDKIVQVLVECGADNMKQNRKKETPFQVCHNYQVLLALKHQERELTRSQVHKPAKASFETTSVKPVSVKTSIYPKKLGNSAKLMYSKNVEDVQNKKEKEVEKLLRAVSDNDINMVSYILGWNMESDTKVKCHPLCRCNKCHPEDMDMDLNVNSCDKNFQNPLLIASQLGYFEMFKLLLQHGAKLNNKSKTGKTALHLASQYGFSKIVDLLLQNNANPEFRDMDGNSPIFLAAMNGHLSCLKLLLEFNASVNTRNHVGNSPLHMATIWKYSDIVYLLLEHGAMTYYKNERGKTVIDLAQNDPEMLSCFSKEPAQDIITLSDDKSENQSKALPRKSISLSEADESLANELYTKFNNPAPDTPPIYGGEDIYTFESTDDLNSGNQINENLNQYNNSSDDLNTSDLFDEDLNSGAISSTIQKQNELCLNNENNSSVDNLPTNPTTTSLQPKNSNFLAVGVNLPKVEAFDLLSSSTASSNFTVNIQDPCISKSDQHITSSSSIVVKDDNYFELGPVRTSSPGQSSNNIGSDKKNFRLSRSDDDLDNNDNTKNENAYLTLNKK